MSSHAYTENQLVEQPAIGLFAALGWQTVSARGKVLGSGGTLGRETKGEAALVDRLRAALVKLNPRLPADAIRSAIDELTRDRSAMSLEAANREIYRMFKDAADWDRFFEWKRIEREDEPRRVSLEVMLRGTCDPVRLLDLAENFTLFSEHTAGLVKVLGQNHQVLGVNKAIASMVVALRWGHGRGGVFWQTQGSGKSFSMVFFAQKVMRRIAGNWTFVVVTDRVELDDQIAKTFKAVGAVTKREPSHATSSAHLRTNAPR